jgi:hypothetical protein
MWLKSDEFLIGHPKVFTFDLFDLLAEGDPTAPEAGMLRAAHRNGTDSHPNRLANELIGPVFVEFITQSVAKFRTNHSMRSTITPERPVN